MYMWERASVDCGFPPCCNRVTVESESVHVCISEWEAGLLVEWSAGRKAVGWVRNCSPSRGSEQKRMKPVIREVWGRKLSAGGALSWGRAGGMAL